MKPIDAIKQTLVEQGFSQPIKEYEEKLLDVGTKVRYLYQAGELEEYQYKGEKRKRSTDPIWSVAECSTLLLTVDRFSLHYNNQI